MKALHLVFAGTPEFGLPCLNGLRQSAHQIQAIYTQPDRPAGRGRKLQASAVKKWALKQNIPVYQPVNFKNPEAIAELAALKPDVLLVIAYGLILPKAVLNIPKLACINVHASLLPRWRGASPIQHAILHGDQKSGITLMQMDTGMDTGAMLRKVSCPITSLDTASSLHDKLAQIAVQPLLETLDSLVNNTGHAEIQAHELATYATKIHKKDARINWQQTAIEIDRAIRAFNPWPIAYTHFGEVILRIHKAQVIAMPCSQTPGTVIALDKKGIWVATADQILLIEQVQLPGARVISAADWLNSLKSSLYPGFIF